MLSTITILFIVPFAVGGLLYILFATQLLPSQISRVHTETCEHL